MKKHGWIMILLALALALCTGAAAAGETAEAGLQQDILILFTSDVHCGVDQGFTYGGLAAIRDTAEAAGDHVLLVDNGDSIQGEAMGTLTTGMANIELMNAVGYDVAIPGNHEFDYGMDRFMELAAAAEFPYISCNFHRDGKTVFPPYIIMEFDGVKIALVGATTPETLVSASPRTFQDSGGNFIYDFSQGGDGSAFYAAVQQATDAARAEGASYVILMGHLGDEAACRPYTYADVVEHTTGIDAVLDGHSHDIEKVVMKNADGKTVIRQACGTKLEGVGWLRISAADGSVQTGLYTWHNDRTVPDVLGIENGMTAKVAECVGSIMAQLTDAFGFSTTEMTINDPATVSENGRPIRIIRQAETNMGDLCADAFRQAAGTEVAVINGGGIRDGIDAGEISEEDILNVFPFRNAVLKVEVTGQQILDALEWGARTVPEENGAFLHVSGMTYEIHTYIDSSCTWDDNGIFTGVTGEYRVKNVMIGGEPLDPERTYTLAVADYLVTDNGNGMSAFDNAMILGQVEKPDFEILTDYITDTLNGVIGDEYANPYGQGRIVAVEE